MTGADDVLRVDGRELPTPAEPGSDVLLLLGLFALLRRLNPKVEPASDAR